MFFSAPYNFVPSLLKETCLDTPETNRDGKEPFVNIITYTLKEVITVIDEQDISKHKHNDNYYFN